MEASLSPPPRPMGGGNCSNEQGSRVDVLNGGGEDCTRAYILQVKEELERCMDVGMSKEQMFQKLREKGIHPAITFAVYRELRSQNHDFFKKYYSMVVLKKHTERGNSLLQKYLNVSGAAAAATGTGAPAAPPAVMAIPDVYVGLPEQQIAPAGLYDASLVNSMSGGHQFAGSANQLHVVAEQLLRQRKPHVFNDGVQVPPAPSTTYNDAMNVSYPQLRTDCFGVSWHSQQALSLEQWSTGAGAVAPPGSYLQPPSFEMLQENLNRRGRDASLHGEQAPPLHQWSTCAGAAPVPPPGSYLQPRSSDEILLENSNRRDHYASMHGEQTEHLQQWGPGWETS